MKLLEWNGPQCNIHYSLSIRSFSSMVGISGPLCVWKRVFLWWQSCWLMAMTVWFEQCREPWGTSPSTTATVNCSVRKLDILLLLFGVNCQVCARFWTLIFWMFAFVSLQIDFLTSLYFSCRFACSASPRGQLAWRPESVWAHSIRGDSCVCTEHACWGTRQQSGGSKDPPSLAGHWEAGAYQQGRVSVFCKVSWEYTSKNSVLSCFGFYLWM